MRKATLANSFAKGVLDPHLSERNDLAHRNQSLADAENVVFAPQGGFADRGGTRLVSDADVLAAGIPRRLRRRLEPIQLTAGMLTAVNGGVAANVIDQISATVMTTGAVSATPFVLLDINLGGVRVVDAVDVINFVCGTVGVNETLAVEWYDAGAGVWRAFGGSADNAPRKHVRTLARTRRFAGWPGQSIAARNWRIVLYGAAGAGIVSIGGVRMWAESAAPSAYQLITMARSVDERYELVLSDRNIDVFQNMRWQAAIPVAVASEQVEQVGIETSLDNLLLFHEDIETINVVRQGSAGEWNAAAVPWANVPLLTVTTTYGGSQDEVQFVSLATVTAGQSVVMALGDSFSAPMVYIDDATFAAALPAALVALTGTAAANVRVNVVGAGRFRVAFVDANGSRAWPLLSVIVLGGVVAAPPTEIAQRGLDASTNAPLWGPRTGYPRCGAYVQSRFLVAGFRAAPTSWRVSMVQAHFDFLGLGNPATADRSFGGALDVDEIETIHHVFVGRHVQLFTESGEWFIETRTYDAVNPPNLVLATRNGIKSTVAPVFADGTTLFVQAGGQTLRDFAWADGEQSYKADPLSLLGPHLLTNVVGMAHRTARSVRDGSRIVMINADGTAAVLTLLRSQDVVAIAPWSTAYGAFRAAGVDLAHNLLMICDRDHGATLETVVPEMPLDCATTFTGVGLTVLAGLPFADGREVWAYADDHLVGPLTVSSGAVTLPVPAAVAIVGLAPPFRARLPVVCEAGGQGGGQPWRPPMRIFEAGLSLDRTGDITIATNGGAHQAVPLTRAGTHFDRGGPLQTVNGGDPTLPMLQRLYTGDVRIQGLTGWTEHSYIEISRASPAPVRVKSVRLEIAHG